VTQHERWAALRKRITETGLRNSLPITIAPTATIVGCYQCIEPQVSNLFKRETMSGEFLQVNTALVTELKGRGLWTPQVREAIKRADGSVQQVTALPDEVRCGLKATYYLRSRPATAG
jgi:ribonucleoside-diphosphate reductase alpha chain